MADALVRQIGLVSETANVSMSDLSLVSAAIQRQITRDFGPLWSVDATVDVFNTLENVPLGYWPVILRDDINSPGAGGFHSDQNGQPFSLVLASADIPTAEWQLATSHECLEMLADPFGNRTVPGDSPNPEQGRVELLVEVCDPSEASQFAYTVNGIMVSDFYTPRYFDPVVSAGVQYSYKGYITEPRQVLPGGYLSWHEPETNHWWQKIANMDGTVKFQDLGELNASNGSIRSQIDRMSAGRTKAALDTKKLAAANFGLQLSAIRSATDGRAKRLHSQIDLVLGGKQRVVPERRPPGKRA